MLLTAGAPAASATTRAAPCQTPPRAARPPGVMLRELPPIGVVSHAGFRSSSSLTPLNRTTRLALQSRTPALTVKMRCTIQTAMTHLQAALNSIMLTGQCIMSEAQNKLRQRTFKVRACAVFC